jgi:hypothetical protein
MAETNAQMADDAAVDANRDARLAIEKTTGVYWASIKSLIGQMVNPMDTKTFAALHAQLTDTINNMEGSLAAARNLPLTASPVVARAGVVPGASPGVVPPRPPTPVQNAANAAEATSAASAARFTPRT